MSKVKSKFDRVKHKQLLNDCTEAQKQILKGELSNDKFKHIEYTTILTKT